MYLDTVYLNECNLIAKPAITLHYGELRKRVITLSPFMVPMADGIALIQEDDVFTLYGVGLNDRAVGDPSDVVYYLAERMWSEYGNMKVIAYGPTIELIRKKAGWELLLGETLIATFHKSNNFGEVAITDLELKVCNSDSNRPLVNKLTQLITMMS